MEILNYQTLIYSFIIDLCAILILARLIYYPRHQNKDFLFTFVIFNLSILVICQLMSQKDLGMSFAFGLFAIFSIIRYRTVTIPVREMGYFFVSVSLGLINSFHQDLFVLLSANSLLLLFTFILDKDQLDDLVENSKIIIITDLELIHLEKSNALLEDLISKMGINFHRVQVVSVDYFRQLAKVKAYYMTTNKELLDSKTGREDD